MPEIGDIADSVETSSDGDAVRVCEGSSSEHAILRIALLDPQPITRKPACLAIAGKQTHLPILRPGRRRRYHYVTRQPSYLIEPAVVPVWQIGVLMAVCMYSRAYARAKIRLPTDSVKQLFLDRNSSSLIFGGTGPKTRFLWQMEF